VGAVPPAWAWTRIFDASSRIAVRLPRTALTNSSGNTGAAQRAALYHGARAAGAVRGVAGQFGLRSAARFERYVAWLIANSRNLLMSSDPEPGEEVPSRAMIRCRVNRELVGDQARLNSFPQTTASCPAGVMSLHREAVSEFRFIPPCSPIPATEVPAGDGWLHETRMQLS
jgi:hypothetical protein